MRQAIVLAVIGILAAEPSLRPASAQQPANAAREAAAARIEAGTADPAADARAAAASGEFGLIVAGDGGRSPIRPRGVECFTPYGKPPSTRFGVGIGDAIGDREMRWLNYIVAYNTTLVDLPDYPDADLCRAWKPKDGSSNEFWSVDKPARPLSTPVRSLHEAARRGSAADLRKFMQSTEINSFDTFGMTALAWAVARGNDAAVDVLVSASADPWADQDYYSQNSLFWAAAFGRIDLFERLAKLPGRKWHDWPHIYVRAALGGKSQTIIQHMLSEIHDAITLASLSDLPPDAVLVPVFKAHPDMADKVLNLAAGSPGRPNLVKLALEYGANPNSTPASGSGMPPVTALVQAAQSRSPTGILIVEMLLNAGADPDKISGKTRPLWAAVGELRRRDKTDATDQRAIAIFNRLIAAGAHINLPDDLGTPPIHALLFARYTDSKLDALNITPELLEMLVRNGLDLNAQHKGKRVLPLVEAQAGPDSELAVTLRRLGASP